jgi:hypothetical protein
MDLHCGFCDTDIASNLLVEATLHDADHYFTLPCTKRFEARFECAQVLFSLAASTIASEAEVYRIDQVLITARVKWNTAPSGSFASAHNRPPCPSTIERQIESPNPIPLGLVVWKESKTRLRC